MYIVSLFSKNFVYLSEFPPDTLPTSSKLSDSHDPISCHMEGQIKLSSALSTMKFYATRIFLTSISVLFQASMLSQPDGPFINLSKLNFNKYAQRPNLSKVILKVVRGKIFSYARQLIRDLSLC